MFNQQRVKFVACLLTAAAALHSQEKVSIRQRAVEQVSLPQTLVRQAAIGYIFDASNRRLHLISGVPGASLLSPPIKLETELAAARVSPNQDYILGLTGDSHEIRLFEITDFIQPEARIPGVSGSFTQITLSSRGSSALVVDTARRLHVITGLPNKPETRMIADPALSQAELSALAVSDDGGVAIVAIPDENQSRVYVIDSGGSLEYAGRATDVAAIQFLNGSREALLLDRGESRLSWIRGSGLELVAGSNDGLARPADLSISRDNRLALIVNDGSSQLLTLDLLTRVSTLHGCLCTPQRVSALGQRSAFQVTNPSDGVVWIFAPLADGLRFTFVPPASNGRTASPAETQE